MQNPSSQTPRAGRDMTVSDMLVDGTIDDARQRLYATFRRDELVWKLNERYEPSVPAWDFDILRQGAAGRWAKQRYRFDASAQVLYFLGESSLNDDEFRTVRRDGTLISLAAQ